LGDKRHEYVFERGGSMANRRALTVGVGALMLLTLHAGLPTKSNAQVPVPTIVEFSVHAWDPPEGLGLSEIDVREFLGILASPDFKTTRIQFQRPHEWQLVAAILVAAGTIAGKEMVTEVSKRLARRFADWLETKLGERKRVNADTCNTKLRVGADRIVIIEPGDRDRSREAIEVLLAYAIDKKMPMQIVLDPRPPCVASTGR
jgi:hypothetical protein